MAVIIKKLAPAVKPEPPEYMIKIFDRLNDAMVKEYEQRLAKQQKLNQKSK